VKEKKCHNGREEGLRMEAAEINALVGKQRAFFDAGGTRDVRFRIEMLKKLGRALEANRSAILKALKADMGKPTFEAYAAEISHLQMSVAEATKRVASWSRPRRVRTPSLLLPASSNIYPEPLGVALIIGPWNYPGDLIFEPLIGAVAAGNCATLKPSEVTENTSRVIARIVADNFDPAFVAVVEGDAETAQCLLAERFDYIFYTGGGVVGRLVMEAAAKNLTPVTLELGGKSPCIVEPDIHLDHAARRIAWGKWFNAGQTCIAPDYLLVNRAVKSALLSAIKRYIKVFYGEDPEQSPDYARIVSDRHFDRISNLLDEGQVIAGGLTNRESRYIAPTIIDNVSPDHKIMQEEIFGPVLPVLDYDSLDEAIAVVNARQKPLALYFFSRDKGKQRRVLGQTTSGGGCINDTLVYYSNDALPFGGVGESGFGKYHGKASFDTFSNMRSVVTRSFLFDVYLRYPPYKNHARPLARFIRFIT
jgi:acyl-CoA reductase-like NAD-dependent aldehyde dehydrogenase